MVLALALASGATLAVAGDDAEPRGNVPDLGVVRYRDPAQRRELWLGGDVGGAVLPARLGLFNRTVWTVHGSPAWSLAILDWLAVGGRHSIILYDAQNIRLREHDHQVELSARTLALRRGNRPFVDRFSIGFSTHAIKKSTVDGLAIKPGGLNDTIVQFGYGLSHDLARRWRLDWRVEGRYAWVLNDTQRQVRASVRGSWFPRPPHRLSVEGVGFYVHRNPDQAGNPLPQHGVYGQFAGEYIWMSRHNVGPVVTGRFLTSFRSGEAPVYEIREEAINSIYGELIAGFRFVWK